MGSVPWHRPDLKSQKMNKVLKELKEGGFTNIHTIYCYTVYLEKRYILPYGGTPLLYSSDYSLYTTIKYMCKAQLANIYNSYIQ